MGNRSKSQEPGAFGSKQFTAEGVAIARPNRGRQRWKHGKIKMRRGFKPLKLGEIVRKNAAKAKAAEAIRKTEAKPKTGFIEKVRRVFQRRGA